jgi:outer membrane protein OmpA-like peptidoglycan-associated protein
VSHNDTSTSPPQHRTGAVRADEPRRKRGLLWLLLGLLALLLLIGLAIALYLALRDDDDAADPAPAGSAVAGAPAPAGSSAPGVARSGAAPSGSAGAGATAGSAAGSAAGAGGLVGGSVTTAIPAANVTDGAALATPGTFGTVLFAEDSAEVNGNGRQVVDKAVQQLRSSGARAVTVTGYTDVVGGQPVNSDLSKNRADAVAALLRQQLGSAVTVTTAARGQEDPAAPNDTAAHRQLNRRATISAR